MSDDQRPQPKFGSTAVMDHDQTPPSRRNTIAMGSVRKDDPGSAPGPHGAVSPHEEKTRAMPAIAMPAMPFPMISPVEEKTRVMRPDSVPPPTIATPPMTGEPDGAALPADSGIEIVVIEEHQLPGGERKPWRAAEVWTKRRVYALDSTYKCVEVLDRESGRPEPTHEMLGARLGGGRRRDGDAVRFTYPLPLPGTEAMFMKAKKHGYTSPVERMVVRVRALLTSAEEVAPSWDEIATRWSDPPPRP